MSFVNYPTSLPEFKELFDEKALKELISSVGEQSESVLSSLDVAFHPFIDAFKRQASLTNTTNGALTYKTTLDNCLDLFYAIENVHPRDSDRIFQAAWDQDPLVTLHIIFYARSIHHGKSDRESFYVAFGWLLKNHPQTALINLPQLTNPTCRTNAELNRKRKFNKSNKDDWEMIENQLLERVDFKTHGYWKDLTNILAIYAQGEFDTPPATKMDFKALRWPRKPKSGTKGSSVNEREIRHKLRLSMTPENRLKDAQLYIKMNQEDAKQAKLDAQQTRHQLRADRNAKVCQLLKTDLVYRSLHLTIARLFAVQLEKDMVQLEANKVAVLSGERKGAYALGFNLSLAAKWAPSLGYSHDKHTFLATSIAECLFPNSQDGESRADYLNRARELYRMKYLSPLRKAIDLTEHHMHEGAWETVDFRHVPSICLQNTMPKFFLHAPDKVVEYMDSVADGTRKVSGATLGPHELVYKVREGGNIDPKLEKMFQIMPELRQKFIGAQGNMVNGQWDTLIQSIRETALLSTDEKDKSKKKKIDLGDCIAICDVSGSMMCGGTSPETAPLNAAIGLSLVVTNLAKPPFNGALITFSSNPELFNIDTTKTFTEQVNEVCCSAMGYNTDICAVFTKVLLPMAKKHHLKQEDMVKRMFVFTDMEFDAEHNGMDTYLTTHEFIKKEYRDAGYELPELVWWNLCSNDSYIYRKGMITPVQKDEAGVSLLAGFSSSMIKTFFEGDVDEDGDEDEDEILDSQAQKPLQEKPKKTPIDFMLKAVHHESFKSLVVVD